MHATSVNSDRLIERHKAISRFGATDRGGVSRQAFSVVDAEAKLALLDWAKQRGFECAADIYGNLFVRRPGRNDGRPVQSGSHLDSQPKGGNFDGVCGVLAALEVMETLEDSKIITDRAIELVIWANEEGSRFAPPTMGSGLFTARLQSLDLASILDSGGISVQTAMAEFREWTQAVPLSSDLNYPHCYLELHIEQGPRLEDSDQAIGVVTGIQGMRSLEISISGKSGHAGTTPMGSRADAFHEACELIARMRRAMDDPADEVRFTIGRFEVGPNSPNTIPDQVIFNVDFRHPVAEVLQRSGDQLVRECDGWSGRCRVVVKELMHSKPVVFDSTLVALVEDCSNRREYPNIRMVSGATHDAQNLSHVCPTAMIFIPCRDGISHHESEYARDDHIVAGANVLLDAITSMAGVHDASSGLSIVTRVHS